MATRYEIRQEVKTVHKCWLEVISSSVNERPASLEYANLVSAHPDEYFELVKIETTETCLSFTPKFDADDPRSNKVT